MAGGGARGAATSSAVGYPTAVATTASQAVLMMVDDTELLHEAHPEHGMPCDSHAGHPQLMARAALVKANAAAPATSARRDGCATGAVAARAGARRLGKKSAAVGVASMARARNQRYNMREALLD
eukprot:CAMPEP_0115858718 /NCGR_PEP_ID=MMETSP0287-20121206/16243_1 /TAXON_ID=412157 /ORGANISM="Chrysochromulina rotalis, Strain UIO044" /LENGTH=124 /DNA_ID=CAMNT_0003312993 /DNA_START=471 /DNA_END=843 /DNA_ORIENTATION=-